MDRNLEAIQDLPDRSWECDRAFAKWAIALADANNSFFCDRTLRF